LLPSQLLSSKELSAVAALALILFQKKPAFTPIIGATKSVFGVTVSNLLFQQVYISVGQVRKSQYI